MEAKGKKKGSYHTKNNDERRKELLFAQGGPTLKLLRGCFSWRRRKE